MSADVAADLRERIAVARIVRPRGNRGEVLAEILTESAERFSRLRELTVESPAGSLPPLILDRYWMHAGRLVLKFQGVDSISDAEQLRGSYLLIEREERLTPGAGSYFLDDLVSCRVEDGTGRTIGIVQSVLPTEPTRILVVESHDGKEILIPFTEGICPRVEIERKRIVIEPPEGLLDL